MRDSCVVRRQRRRTGHRPRSFRNAGTFDGDRRFLALERVSLPNLDEIRSGCREEIQQHQLFRPFGEILNCRDDRVAARNFLPIFGADQATGSEIQLGRISSGFKARARAIAQGLALLRKSEG